MKKKSEFPPGWDEARVRRIIEHYESQTEEEAIAEAEAAFEDPGQTVMLIPKELVPKVRALLSEYDEQFSEQQDQARHHS